MRTEALRPEARPVLLWPLGLLLAAVAIAILFYDGLAFMIDDWSKAEYSYAYIVPVISAIMIWQKRDAFAGVPLRGQWLGVPIVLFGVLVGIFGELSTIYTVIHYAVLIVVYGIAFSILGWTGVRTIIGPLVYLAFIVPLPDFLYQGLSTRLQLVSSTLGVALIRPFGISVFLEGNVIDLGVYQLQVVEACSGLRYLFPLLSFSFLCAYLYKGPMWQKLVIFASAAPITILINSVRIGAIGILVDYVGIEAAEGFLHLFEGWIIFLAGVALLFAEIWILARLTQPRTPFWQLLKFELLLPSRGAAPSLEMASWRPFASAVAVLVIAAAGTAAVPSRAEIVPEARSFATFPMAIGEWRGQEQDFNQIYIDALKLDDYVYADYIRPGDAVRTNFYVAYYGSQRKGASAHSPRSCIPGGGWEITELSRAVVPGGPDGAGIPVNRVVIAKGRSKQLVYYWFQQRGRHMTNEYQVKWMIFWDALTRNRTDGALVRVITPVLEDEDLAAADRRLGDFVRAVYTTLEAYVPS